MTVDDVLCRRTRAPCGGPRRRRRGAGAVADLLGPSWDATPTRTGGGGRVRRRGHAVLPGRTRRPAAPTPSRSRRPRTGTDRGR